VRRYLVGAWHQARNILDNDGNLHLRRQRRRRTEFRLKVLHRICGSEEAWPGGVYNLSAIANPVDQAETNKHFTITLSPCPTLGSMVVKGKEATRASLPSSRGSVMALKSVLLPADGLPTSPTV
jgi:hypothetical protein